MSEPGAPFLLTSSFESAKYSNPTLPKFLVSSLARSLFGGSTLVFRNHEMPLFKVERRCIEEIFVSTARQEQLGADEGGESRVFLFDLGQQVKPEPRQWVIFTGSAGLALRNIDHLIPADSKAAHAPAEMDFYLTKVMDRNDGCGQVCASPGLWAVRGEYLPMVLERWKSAWSELGKDAKLDEAAVWSRVVRDLPLRKKPFEKGEVYAPRIGSVDWEAVSHAAFVTVPGWPKEEQRKFLQALYFGTYFGDETGLMLNILDP